MANSTPIAGGTAAALEEWREAERSLASAIDARTAAELASESAARANDTPVKSAE